MTPAFSDLKNNLSLTTMRGFAASDVPATGQLTPGSTEMGTGKKRQCGDRYGLARLPALCPRQGFVSRPVGRAVRALVVFAALAVCAGAWSASGETHSVPYLSPASDVERQGLVRVVNRDDRAGAVSIEAIDDTGRLFGPVTLWVGAGESRHFSSRDLEYGNAATGLSGVVGPGEGAWRLELESELDIEVLAYLRTQDGFVAGMHDVVLPDRGVHWVPIINPGSDDRQVSQLRLTNLGDMLATVRIVGIGDRGVSSEAETVVPGGASRLLSAQELERLGLGDGAGKWQLRLESDQSIRVMNLMRSPAGHLTNLSTAPANVSFDASGAPIHRVPLMPASGDNVQGIVRVINQDDEAGVVTIHAIDDAGVRRGMLGLALEGRQTVNFDSDDLEFGNVAKGLWGGVGSGDGGWRLELQSGLAIKVLAYARTGDGLLTSLHDVAPAAGPDRHVGVFNPGSDRHRVSLLRLVNPGDEAAEVTIVGVDDLGNAPGGGATAIVPAGATVTYTVRELEEGTGVDLAGSIGVGEGKWRLRVTSRQPVQALSLVKSSTGHVTNLSTSTSVPPVRMVPLVTQVEIPLEVAAVDVTVAALGAEGVEVAAGGGSSVLIASDVDGTLMLAAANEDGGYLEEGPGAVQLGIESTAITLVAVASGRRFGEIDRELTESIRSHHEFGQLTRLLAALMASDKNYLDRLYNYPQVVTLIKSVAAGVASVGTETSAATGSGGKPLQERNMTPLALSEGNSAAFNSDTGQIAPFFKEDFYCVPGSENSLGLIPCSPWNDREPWHWFGDAAGVKAFFPDSYLEWALTIAAPAYGLIKEYAELVWQASGALPFLAVSQGTVRGCQSGDWSCGENGLHATANPNFVNYAMELYEKDVYRDWFYTPGNSTMTDKLLNSGAAYREFRTGPKRTGPVRLSPDIDLVRFQRYRFSFAEGDEPGFLDRGAVVSFMNTMHLIIAAVNVITDVTELREVLKKAAYAADQAEPILACSSEVLNALKSAESVAIINGRLALDADPEKSIPDLLLEALVDVAPEFLAALQTTACTNILTGGGEGRCGEACPQGSSLSGRRSPWSRHPASIKGLR